LFGTIRQHSIFSDKDKAFAKDAIKVANGAPSPVGTAQGAL
jgi:hypothetical protein